MMDMLNATNVWAYIADNDTRRSNNGDSALFNTTEQPCVATRISIWSSRAIVGPTLESVRTELRWVFLFHAYGFACSFFVLAFYSFFSILNIRSLITSRPFMSTINVFLCLLGATRSCALFIDPYNLKESMPRSFGAVIWDIGFPSVTSAFALVQLAFLQLTQLKIGPERMRHKSCLSLVITAHITCILAVDIVCTFHDQLHFIKYIVQTVFLIWGFFLCCNFLYAGYRVMSLLNSVPSVLLQRDSNTQQYKGIMQLAMLAPYNNLASSVATALVPTLLAPQMATFKETTPNDIVSEASTSTQSLGASKSGLDQSSSADLKTVQLNLPVRKSAGTQPVSEDNFKINKSKLSDATGAINENPRKLKNNLSWRGDQLPSEVFAKSKLSFKKKTQMKLDSSDEEVTSAATTLLPQRNSFQAETSSGMADLTLHTILNHIAYVNRAACHTESGLAHGTHNVTPDSRKKQVISVLRVTYTTAILGLILCIADFIKMYGPYGLLSQVNWGGSKIREWPWLCFQTVCRSLELAMGCAMANMTKQPVTQRQNYILQSQYGHTIRMKQRQSLYM